jgi:4-carboxymuconolactone decarboxylase
MGEDLSQERFMKALGVASEMFAGSPSFPRFPVPAEVDDAWNTFSVGVVMGEVWPRSELDKQQRAMITIALLTALAKPEQLRVYVGVGMNLGLSRAQICEIIWHTAIYAGFPAAVEGFRIAGEAFAEYDAADDGDGRPTTEE